MTAELMVDVSDAGRPVVAEAVWLMGSAGATRAYCMIHEGLGRCATWFGAIDSNGPVTVVTEVCGTVYAQALTFPVDANARDRVVLSQHITVQADATACGRTVLPTCAEVGTSPALSVSTVGLRGEAMPAAGVQIEQDGGPSAPADCLEGVRQAGCTEWASQHTRIGRYRATAQYCGQSFATGWIDVASDDSGCRAVAQSVELVLDPGACIVPGTGRPDGLGPPKALP